MNTIGLSAAFALLGSPAMGYAAPAGVTAQNEPIAAVALCYVEAASRLDDGVSDASTIAKAMIIECHKKIEAEKAMVPGKWEDQPLEDRRNFDIATEQTAVTELLEIRRSNRLSAATDPNKH